MIFRNEIRGWLKQLSSFFICLVLSVGCFNLYFSYSIRSVVLEKISREDWRKFFDNEYRGIINRIQFSYGSQPQSYNITIAYASNNTCRDIIRTLQDVKNAHLTLVRVSWINKLDGELRILLVSLDFTGEQEPDIGGYSLPYRMSLQKGVPSRAQIRQLCANADGVTLILREK